MKKVGIIRCQQTEDICLGTTDFKVASMGELGFEPLGMTCPHHELMKEAVAKKTWLGYSHP